MVTRPRVPVVTGLGRGVGTSTVAAALHARDGGTWASAADIVVCHAGGESLRAAELLRLAPFGLRPVLAVVRRGAAPGASRARLSRLEGRFAAVLTLPHVPRWQVLDNSLDDAGELLAQPRERLPPALQGYAAAMHGLAAAVLRTGQLVRPVPPVVIRPARPGAAGPGPPATLNEDRGPDQKVRTPIPFPELTRRSHHEATCIG